ncbi:MAG: fibronectin type III domain-containing protein, partial [Ruminococcus sp.]|nr:fibronectin type III domain-containing protein [Ruminococcus sp.]
MKKTSKRFLAALLAVLTVFSMLTVVTAFAAETAESAVADQGDPVVGKITGLKKTTTESDRIRVEWNPVDGASGYAVAICDADKAPGTYADMGDTTNTYMGIKGLRQGIMHIIRV